MKPSSAIPTAIVLGGILVAVAVYASTPMRAMPTAGNPALVRPVGPSDHILGNPAAPVVIVEYADFDCEFCKGFNDTLHQIVADEGDNGKVALVYREFPLTELHPDAMQDAEAAECAAQAGGNDAFWAFADSLFANQPADPSTFGALAAAAGIPGNTFAACYAGASSAVDARILADRDNALAVGATGTPYSLILVSGEPPIVMDGAYSYDAAKQLVDQALASVSK